jgi:hypothetical protein
VARGGKVNSSDNGWPCRAAVSAIGIDAVTVLVDHKPAGAGTVIVENMQHWLKLE